MAANVILLDRSKNPASAALSAAQRIRDAREELKRALAAMDQYRNGADNPADASNYALLAAQCSYQAGGYATANDAARASYLEFSSLLSKLTTDNSVTAVLTATDQCCAKHGV